MDRLVNTYYVSKIYFLRVVHFGGETDIFGQIYLLLSIYRLCAVKVSYKLKINLPLVAFKIFKFHAKRVFFVVGQHVYVFISQPEFFGRIAETVLVIRPISVEVFAWFAQVVSPLYYLELRKYITNLP